jgi:hypothetical protein
VGWTTVLAAQTPAAKGPALRGVIVSAAGPVSGAAVRLRSADSAYTLGAVSSETGNFEIATVPAGSWTLLVRRIGYSEHTQTIVLGEGGSVELRITLQAIAHPLDTVAVVRAAQVPERYGPISRMDEFYRRRARGRGRFYTREDLEESGRSSLTDLLRVVPGARVRTQPGNLADVWFTRCSTPVRLSQSGRLSAVASGTTGGRVPYVALYVDGVPVDTASLRQTLAELRLADIEAVEVYRGVSELPLEAMGNACAAIFVWMRFGPGP